MAPWPEQGNEPKAPDKSCPKGVESNPSDSSKVDSGIQEDPEARSVLGKTDDKQSEKNTGVSELDDGQLKALLDEAITYKRPKDREGKSHLFRELLEEVEAESDGGEEANPPPFGVVDQCRSSKRHRRDVAVSERQTRGGSLQNIVQAYSDFEIAYSGSRGRKSLGGGGGRRRDLGHYGPGLSGGGGRSGGGSGGSGGGGPGGSSGGSSVSARQREGGSLPCNVNAGSGGGSGGVGPLHGNPGECPFEDVVNRRRSEQTVVVSWDKSDEDVMPAQMDRGGGGGTAVAAPPPGADGVAVGKSSEAGAGERASEGGGMVVGAPSAKEPPPECVEATAPGPARVVDGGGVVFANGVSSLSDGPQQQGAGGQERDGVELRAQRCASLLSATVEDRTADGVELQLIPENRSGRGKFKDEVCRAEPSPCTSEVLEYVSEQSPVTSPTSLVAAAPSAGNHKTLREMVLGDSVDTVVPFPLHSEEKKPALASASSSLNLDLSKGLVNGTETKPLQLLSTYPSVNSVVGPTSQVSSISEPLPSASLSTIHSGCAENQTIQSGVLEERSVLSVATKDAGVRKQSGESGGPKSMMPIHQGTYPLPTHHLSVLTYPPNHWFSASDTVSRLNFHGGKDLSDIKSKSLDENGNAVTVPQGLNRDAHEKGKGKVRRLKVQDEGYMSQSVEGYCGDQDLDRVLKFIGMDEDKKSKNSCSGPVDRVRRNNIRRESDRSVGSEFTRVRSARDRNYMEEDIATASSDKTSSGPKVGPRSAGGGRQNEIQRGNMMKKSNSLEEISRTKSEDLTIPASYSLPSKEVVVPQTVEHVDGKEGGCESGAKDEDMCDHYEKLVRDDNNGNAEIVDKSLVPSAPPKVPIAVTSFKEDFYAVTDASPQVLEETEFHVVTKKQRRKKRKGGANGDGGGSGLDGRGGTQNTHSGYSCGGSVNNHGDRSDDFSRGCDHMEEGNKDNKAAMWGSAGGSDGRFCSYRRHHRRHRGQRSGDCIKSTFSVPPSEHSGESSDDTGSVHSLPVSSSVPRPSADRCSTSSGSTPQASYADIARMPFSTMPVVAGNAGCVPVGNLTALAPTQKPKAPTTATPSGQISNFPPMTSANTLSTPSVPHFASAKIGTPPVSGYKTVIVVPTPVSTVDPTQSAVSCTPPNPKPVPQALPSEEHENVSEAEVSIQISVSVSLEPRKKDAMTCTTLDCKTVVNNYTASTVFSTQPKIEAVEAAAHGVFTSTPNILEDYYPSLQESIQEKTERRNGKLGQQSASMNKVSPVEEKRSSKTTTVSSSVPFTRENKVPEAETPVSRVGLVGDKAAAVPVLGKPPPVPVSRKTKEPSVTPTRIKGTGRKPGFRSLPPVVIMDHHYRQDSASKEGSTVGDCNDVAGSSTRNCTSSDIGGFTFGFEVNEELLALSAVDTVESHDPPSSCSSILGEDKRLNGSPSLAVEEESPQLLPAKPVISPVAQCVPSGNELPVFRSPGDIDTKKFNYEKIVSFIGSSWEDVMKEVSVPAAKPSSNRVQYYDGTQ